MTVKTDAAGVTTSANVAEDLQSSATAQDARFSSAAEKAQSRPLPLWFKLALLACVVVFTLFFLAFASALSNGFEG